MGLFSGQFHDSMHDTFQQDYLKPVVVFFEDESRKYLRFLRKLESLGLKYTISNEKIYGRERYPEDDWWDVRWIIIDFRELRLPNEEALECVERLWNERGSNRRRTVSFMLLAAMMTGIVVAAFFTLLGRL